MISHCAPVWKIKKLNETLIISASEDCTIKLWDWEYGECVKTLLSHSNAIWGLTISTGDVVATGSWDKTVKIWDVR